tara:strand:- start:2028 stop:3449 length:1422 start_codon:yes stop_codon:yes gene_type:complete
MRKFIISILTSFLITINLIAQHSPEIVITLLENDNIADVNVDQERFIESIGVLKGVTEKAFSNIKDDQKIGVLITVHPEGNHSVEVFSNPEIKKKQKEAFLEKILAIKVDHTKLVDFPILFLINSKFTEYQTDFNGLVSPVDARQEQYDKASLKEKYELNKTFAIEALKVLSAYQTIVDPKYTGVVNTGTFFTKTDFSSKQEISKLLDKNADYWRAVLEMSQGNQLLPITKIFALVAQGEFDYALKHIEIVRMFSSPNSISDNYLNDLYQRLGAFNQVLNSEIQEGFKFHNTGKYQEAIAIYKGVLKLYPNSAWSKYEVYFSQNALSLESGDSEMSDQQMWNKAKVGVYKSNPLYNMDVNASNGKEGYLLFRRLSIASLFKDKDKRLDDLYEYANIAMDLEVYDFSAQLFWFLASRNEARPEALKKFLYSIEKLGVTNLKSNFKGDFKLEFKKIEEEQSSLMKNSATYKSFKD